MIQKTFMTIALLSLCAGTLLAQQGSNKNQPYYKCYAGSSAFMLANLGPNSNSFYQLNFGYRLTPKDVLSVEAITWRYDAPVGIPYGPSFGKDSEKYPGSIREYGVGLVYQRFWWKGLYSSLQVLPLKRKYLDENGKKIQSGFRLFSTLKTGWHIPILKNRFFIEPSVGATYWPVNTNVPQVFAAKDKKWNNYFLFEPGLHFGIKF